MLQTGSHVFVDTNVIIEAHRTNVWKALRGVFQLDTVMRCVEELNTGRKRPVVVDTAALVADLHPKEPTPGQLAQLRIRYPKNEDLDPGERELIAVVLSLAPDTYFLCSPDKAAIRAAYALGIIDQYVTLEHLTEIASARADLQRQYGKAFLSEQRTKLLLEMP